MENTVEDHCLDLVLKKTLPSKALPWPNNDNWQLGSTLLRALHRKDIMVFISYGKKLRLKEVDKLLQITHAVSRKVRLQTQAARSQFWSTLPLCSTSFGSSSTIYHSLCWPCHSLGDIICVPLCLVPTPALFALCTKCPLAQIWLIL